MSEPTRIAAPDGVAPATRYSHAVLGTGRFVAVSGQLALGEGGELVDEDGELVGEGGPAAQARQVFENLRCPAAAGAAFEDVVRLTCFVTDIAHLPAIRAARAAHIPDDRPPAASAVQAAAPAAPQFLMEVEALAVVAP
ncbi:Rid family hydrolase [Streptomyces sp. NPDC054834]